MAAAADKSETAARGAACTRRKSPRTSWSKAARSTRVGRPAAAASWTNRRTHATGVADGATARLTTRRGSVTVSVEVTDTMQRGHVSLPNGLGVDYPDSRGAATVTGAAPNELTASEDRDWFAGTPWHKHVPARVEAVTS